MNLTGIWEDDNAIYLVRSAGANVWWLSEERNLAWVHAFKGVLAGGRLHGQWADLPKGANQGSGEIDCKVSRDEKLLTVIANSGDTFGPKEIRRTKLDHLPSAMSNLFQEVDATFVKNDLTGHWTNPNGDSFYLRQDGSTLWWLGENVQQGWCHVFHGTAGPDICAGDWADVPKGEHLQQGGPIGFDISTQGFGGRPQVLFRRPQPNLGQPFSPRELIRSDANTALGIELASLHCVKTTGGIPNADSVFALLFGADLAGLTPRFVTRLSGPTTMDDGDDQPQGVDIWGLAVEGEKVLGERISNPDDIVLIAGLVENDQPDPGATRGTVNGIMGAQLASALTSGSDRAAIVTQLGQAMKDGINVMNALPFNLGDDLIDVDEIRVTWDAIRSAWRGHDVVFETTFKGQDARYIARWRIYRSLLT